MDGATTFCAQIQLCPDPQPRRAPMGDTDCFLCKAPCTTCRHAAWPSTRVLPQSSPAGGGVPDRPRGSPLARKHSPAARRSRSRDGGSRPSWALIGRAGGPAARRLVQEIRSRGWTLISCLSGAGVAGSSPWRRAEPLGCGFSRSPAVPA